MTTSNFPDSNDSPYTTSGDLGSSGSTGTSGASGSSGNYSSGSGTSGAKEQAKETAGTAKDEGKHVAGVATDEAKKVAAEAKSQAVSLLNQATSQVDEQSRAQKSKLADTVRNFSDDLESMASQSDTSGLATQVAQQVADQARTLSSHLDARDPSDLLDDIRDFARRKPGAFLLGSLAAGVIAGRLTRGAKEAKDSGTSRYTSATTGPTYTPADPMTSGYTAPSGVGVTDPTLVGGTPGVSPSTTSFDTPQGGRI